MTLPKISVVTPCFNSIATIRDTIESVRRQDYPAIEHIVMDGGSTDGTVELLKSCPSLKFWSGPDEGHYDAMNQGTQRSAGEIVAVLNADDCYTQGTLRAVGEAFASHPDWDALFGDIRYVDAEGEEIYRREEACFDYDVLRFGLGYVIHPTVFMRRKVFDALGGYRHKIFKNTCDFDLFCRMGRAGCRVGHLPQILVDYRIHSLGQTADMRIRENMRKEDAQIQREHGKAAGWLGGIQRIYAKIRRQTQKLFIRGKIDLVSGNWKSRRHLVTKATFSSNIGLDKI